MITQEQLPMVAIPSMNNTHLEEMLIINKLDTATRTHDVDGVAKLLRELLEHTTLHFSNEEEMMKEALYTEYETHKNEHDRHLKELAHLIKYFDEKKDPNAIFAYVTGNLIPWTTHHIETMDTMSALFISEN